MDDLRKPESQRAIIAFLTYEGSTPSEIHARLVNQLEEFALSRTQVFSWAKQFREGRRSIGDEERPGRPIEATSQTAIADVERVIQENRRCTVSEIVAELGLTRGTVHRILKEQLYLSKLSARWVPRLLNAEQRIRRVECSQENLTMLRDEGADDFWARFMTTDETWLPFFTPDTKEASKQWLVKGATPPLKAKTSPVAKKIMMTAFWDEYGIIHLDFLPDGETINADYYCRILQDVHHNLRHRRRGKKAKIILLHQDNARPHTARKTIDMINELCWDLISHPPYSPDLAPSDYALFPYMKSFLRGRRFNTRAELEEETKSVLRAISPQWFRQSIRKLEERWGKCVALEGDYVEKVKLPQEDE